ncbi:MAG: YIP1 family protein [Candidatus Tumulicola sp.]
MGLDTGGTPKANGLKTALDTIVAPKEAFEQLRAAPTWGWALLLTIVLYAAASYLMTPALLHATAADWPRQIAASPQLAQLSPEQQQGYLTFSLRIVRWVWLFAPIIALVVMLVQAVVMLVFKALGKGDAPFRSLWAAAANIALPVLALNALITAVIVMVRGADSFNSPAEIQTALPSLALIVPASAIKLHAFLAAFNPFTLWGCGLTVAAMAVVAKVPRAWAWTAGIVELLLSAGLIALTAR